MSDLASSGKRQTQHLVIAIKRASAARCLRSLSLCLSGFCLLLLVPCSFAAEVAVLHNGFSIRHQRRELVGSVTRLYLGADNSGYVDVPTADIDHFEPDLSLPTPTPRNSAPLPDLVTSTSSRYHLDPDLVNSVIRAESGFNAKAVSPKGAQGLMQLMPSTASKLGVSNAFDPRANVDGGTRYLRALLEQYNFDLLKALAAYNAGPARIQQYHGIPPYYETRAYVAKIVRDFNSKKLAERKLASKKSAYSKAQRAQKTPNQTSSLAAATQPGPR
ncbi:MAG TPA: lytic transglycosylase domain-containing protein [Terriglobales bacterium]|nr:lytic transglycosylase domain-containing protein [Terriglobales bacterium]